MNRLVPIALLALAGAGLNSIALAQSTIELVQADGSVLSIPLDSTQPVRIDPASGSLDATATSDFSCGGGCDDVRVSFDGNLGSFITVDGSSSTSVVETGSVTFDWRVRGAWECQGGGLPGTAWNDPGKRPWGPFAVSVSALEPGTYDASLTCTNGLGNTATSASLEVNVEASELQVPTACEGRQPGGSEATALCEVSRSGYISSTNCFEYASVFGGEFPGQTGQGINIGQPRDTYFAMAFNTDNLSLSRGFWGFEAPQVSPTESGPRIMTISQCPGDFDKDAIDAEMGPDCYLRTNASPTFASSIEWKLEGTSGSRCELDTGKNYYLNIIYTTDASGTPPAELVWDCQSSSTAVGCGNIVAPSASD